VGVITSDITNKKWCEWGELKGVNYSASSKDTPTPIPAEEKESSVSIGSALVNATKVALRSAPSTTASILTRVDKGQRV